MNRWIKNQSGEERKKQFLELLEMSCLIKKVVNVLSNQKCSLSICQWEQRRENLQGTDGCGN